MKHAMVTGCLGIRKNPPPEPVLSQIEAVWLACAVDGEGYIGLYHEVPLAGKWPVLNVTVINTDKRFVEYAAKIMNGYTASYAQSNKNGHYGRKRIHKAEAKGHRLVLSILKQIRPYLIIKQDKADYVINFIENRQWGNFRWPEERRKQTSKWAKATWKNPAIRLKRLIKLCELNAVRGMHKKR